MSAPDPGWYHADGDPQGTARYWDGELWQGDPVPQGSVAGMSPAPTTLPGGRNLGYGQRLGEVGERLLARIIDAIIFIVPVTLIILSQIDFEGDDTNFQVDVGGSVGWALGFIVLGAIYDIGFTSALGGTPGKLVMGLRVVQADDFSMPPSPVHAARRWTPALLGLIPSVGSLLGLCVGIGSGVMISNDDMNRSVYDRVGETYVVKK